MKRSSIFRRWRHLSLQVSRKQTLCTQVQIIHLTFVIFKITCFLTQSFVGIFFSLFIQLVGNPFSLSLKEDFLLLIQPALFSWTISHAIQVFSRFTQMFDGMIPIYDLLGS